MMRIGLAAAGLEPTHDEQCRKDRCHQLAEVGAHSRMRTEKSRLSKPIHCLLCYPFTPWTTAVFSNSCSEPNPAFFIQCIASAVLKHAPCCVFTRMCTAKAVVQAGAVPASSKNRSLITRRPPGVKWAYTFLTRA